MKKIALLALLFFISIPLFSQSFTLQSNSIEGQASLKEVFNGFGCTGENISPQLSWDNAPEGTKSFAVTVYDPDAPTGSGWWHWLVFDIPANSSELKANAGKELSKLLPGNAIQSKTDYGKSAYGGPCPPEGHGPHQYIITVHALKVESLGLNKEASPALVGYYINANTIQKASLIMYYER